MGHEVKSERVKSAANGDHPSGSEAVGDGAGKRLGEAPQQVLDGHGQGESLPAGAQRFGNRIEKNPETGADAER